VESFFDQARELFLFMEYHALVYGGGSWIRIDFIEQGVDAQALGRHQLLEQLSGTGRYPPVEVFIGAIRFFSAWFVADEEQAVVNH